MSKIAKLTITLVFWKSISEPWTVREKPIGEDFSAHYDLGVKGSEGAWRGLKSACYDSGVSKVMRCDSDLVFDGELKKTIRLQIIWIFWVS